MVENLYASLIEYLLHAVFVEDFPTTVPVYHEQGNNLFLDFILIFIHFYLKMNKYKI